MLLVGTEVVQDIAKSLLSSNNIISVGSRLKRTIHPNNPSTLDANSNLASHSRSIALVRKVIGTERLRLFDRTVGSIDSDLANAANVSA